MKKLILTVLLVIAKGAVLVCFCQTNDVCSSDTSCALDPAYRFFEQKQLKAYCATEQGQLRLSKILSLTLAQRMKILKEVDSALNKRPNSLNIKGSSRVYGKDRIVEVAYKKKLPTCFEDPGMFFLIDTYVKKIEKARKQLKLPLKILPRYGSLPNSEINAYTYPPDKGPGILQPRASVIGFNTQLFMFAYQMPKITFPTISVTQDHSRKIAIDVSRKTALSAVSSNPNIKTNFLMAILEFLQLTDPETQPLDSKYDSDLINFTQAMELFAVAHEYGHLIKGHTLNGTKTLALNSSQNNMEKDVVVGTHSWQQELEADQIGMQLLFQVLKNEVDDEKKPLSKEKLRIQYLFKVYSVLFYFKCSDLIDEANFIKKNKTYFPELSATEKSYTRLLAKGMASDQLKKQFSYIPIASHPPAWYRAECVNTDIEKMLKSKNYSTTELQYGSVAIALSKNVELLWNLCLPKFSFLLDLVQKKLKPEDLKEIGYMASPKAWEETFLENPALIVAIRQFAGNAANDKQLKEAYGDALKKDWLLLSGQQVEWGKNILQQKTSEQRKTAICVIGLSGERDVINFLSTLDTLDWPKEDKQLLLKAERFLQVNGKYTSLQGLKGNSSSAFTSQELLYLPVTESNNLSMDSLIPLNVSNQFLDFLRQRKAVRIDGSFATMALYMTVAKTPEEESLSFWADVLLQFGDVDAALNFTLASVKKFPQSANLENIWGNILSAKSDLRGSIAHYQKSLDLGRIDGWPEYNMAKNFADMGDTILAEKWFRQAISRKNSVRTITEYSQYLNEFAWFIVTHFKDTRRFKEALDYSLASNEIVGYSDVNYLDTFAKCLSLNGKNELAMKFQEKVVQLTPDNSPSKQDFLKRLQEYKDKFAKDLKPVHKVRGS